LTPPGATCDLQVHTTASDGQLAPAAVVAEAVVRGLAAIAITDHDTVAGLAAAHAAGAAAGVRVVPGVELAAFDDQREVHLIGLHVTVTPAFEGRLAELRAARRARATAICEKLARAGAPIAVDDVLRAADGAVGRPHVAKVLIAAGFAHDRQDAFDRWLKAGRPGYVPKERFPLSEAIALVHAAGGLAIWAHPGAEGRRTAIERFAALGLDGVEVKHPSHSPDDARRILALVDHLGLVPSGGSDWHGETSGWRVLGNQQVPLEWLARQDARVAARHAVAT
jgi:hypothetical protein